MQVPVTLPPEVDVTSKRRHGQKVESSFKHIVWQMVGVGSWEILPITSHEAGLS